MNKALGSHSSQRKRDIAVVGRACRLPGAANVAELWSLLESGRCAVSEIPGDRWPRDRFGHPRLKERGKSYTWAAGVLDDIWGFDPAVFRISPREAEQIDPQQRLLLELVFEALEDAGIPPSTMASCGAGVYVGASALDHSTIALHDPALADAYFATGNTLSIVSNRVSYIFDLRGPSLTIDTACSSSLVALHEACRALEVNEIDSAVVGGVNILASPFGFVSFSQAMMLSPTGLCQPFSAEADGYVRSEGGVVLILKTFRRALDDGDRIHAVIRATGVNTDGRTSGISLPAEASQARLLHSTYERAEVAADSVVYLEAHGTGTQAGDPVEAAALGAALGRVRCDPLPLGSIKSNVGHLEPASGLAGLVKAMLVLEHDTAPPSLHCDVLNPAIDFEKLNLEVTRAATPLPKKDRARYVGVSSFGFGGVNAHAVISDGPTKVPRRAASPRCLMLSAQTQGALRALADKTEQTINDADAGEAGLIVAATNHRRERMRERVILPCDDLARLRAGLKRFGETGRADAGFVRGAEVDGDRSVVFVFSGNGSQWDGMGRVALNGSRHFRRAVEDIDSYFAPLAGWSLAEKLASPRLGEHLTKTSVAQPLIFAIQAASVRALAAIGVRPSLVVGHSVGEVAAAEAAGALSLQDAVSVIFQRSRLQELARDQGGMAAIIGPDEAAAALVEEIPELEIAARNSYRCIVAAGPWRAIELLEKNAKQARQLKVQRLDLAYPFHTRLMEPAKRRLLETLADIAPSSGATPFLSSIADGIVPGVALDARYWWRNIREPVMFREEIERAIEIGKRVFLEVGPKETLRGHLRDALEHADVKGSAEFALEDLDRAGAGDPFEGAAMRLLALGAHVDPSPLLGPDPGAGVDLPAYPWRRSPYRYGETGEATGVFRHGQRHPLVGARDRAESLEWRNHLDPELEPALADHRVQGENLLSGAAFLEMALAVAREWRKSDAVALVDMDILRPLLFVPGVAREVLCRVSASTSTVEILSRPRLSDAPFVLHARSGMVDCAARRDDVGAPPPSGDAANANEIYAAAAACGLDFGPSYRRLLRARRAGAQSIEVELEIFSADPRYGLDPASLDSSFHGLILLFRELGDEPVPYLPVRFDEIRLIAPAAKLKTARAAVRRADRCAIVADFDLFDDRGRLSAQLRGARYQPARLKPGLSLSQVAIAPRWVPAPPDVCGESMGVDLTTQTVIAAGERVEATADAILLEGWAASAALRLARDFGAGGGVDVDELILSGRLPAHKRRWTHSLFDALEASGLLRRFHAAYRMTEESLPAPEAILATLAAEHPERAVELLRAATAAAALKALAAEGATLAQPLVSPARDTSDLATRSVAEAENAILDRLERMTEAGRLPPGRRLLQIGASALTSRLAAFSERRGHWLTTYDPDARRLERARRGVARSAEVSFASDLDALADRGFDLVLSSGGISRVGAGGQALGRLAAKLAPGAGLVAIEPTPSLFSSLLSGLDDGAFDEDDSPPRDVEDWRARLVQSGLAPVAAVPRICGGDSAIEVMARAPEPAAAKNGFDRRAVDIVIAGEGARIRAFAAAVSERLLARGARGRLVRSGEAIRAGEADSLVWLLGDEGRDEVGRVASQCLALKRLLTDYGSTKLRIFLPIDVERGANAKAIASFSRTLENEATALDIRRVEVPSLTPVVADRLASLVLSATAETDIAIRKNGVEVLRYAAPFGGDETSARAGEALRLEQSPGGGLDKLRWRPAVRAAPKAGQIEVEVVAAGLNFRDVMLALSLLPDDMVEDGFAGPALGLEFSGRVVRAGPGVESIRIGDRVVGFHGGAFSSHVTVDVGHAAPIPASIAFEAAATIPVAFLTAFYSLAACAHLQAGEWVLIHGGAGGVGQAAIQIARQRGARAIVTAGSAAKRELCRALGAEHAFDSRSPEFVDEVMLATKGQGVAVVLNSLAGELMERSLALLEPFGRFIELGKRDYQADTPIGLRPFRRNLSYFGVDVDQLLSARPELARSLFGEVLRGLERGEFAPLPYSLFEHDEIVDAMRLMQQSGHIGKILVRPPGASSVTNVRKRGRFKVAPDRTHLIVGGLGGFGLEAAKWLVDRGARRLALIGRSGASTDAARNAVAAMRAAGAEVRVEKVDVAEPAAADALFAEVQRTMPPLAGVMHAAMTLSDAIIANLDERRLVEVLRPKIAGAENLDRLTRGLELDYFVLFSSATTMIGNPGQGAYVAANGYLEGVARRRRASGLPALAVAWGAIADAGVLARSEATRDAIAARAGVRGMPAKAALDLMAEALASDGGPSDGVLAISDMNWSAARANLRMLRSPSYRRLLNGLEAGEAQARTGIDLREIARRLPPDEARREIADIVVEELARILRLPREDVSRSKPLSEIGLDSLMAVELNLALESRLGLTALQRENAGAFTIVEFATRILSSELSGDANAIVSASLAARHLEDSERQSVVERLTRMESREANGASAQSAQGEG